MTLNKYPGISVSRIFGDSTTAFFNEFFVNFKSSRLTSKAPSHNNSSPPAGKWVYHYSIYRAGDFDKELG